MYLLKKILENTITRFICSTNLSGKGQEDPGLKDQTQKDPDPKDHGPKDPQN